MACFQRTRIFCLLVWCRADKAARFSNTNETSYRPTNDDCLMRAVTSPNFCRVCLETLWLKLLKKVSFIDKVTESCDEGLANPPALFKTISLDLIPLAHLRTAAVSPVESYSVVWKKDGQALEQFENKTQIQILEGKAIGKYEVRVKFATDEVRIPSSMLESVVEYEVKGGCRTAI